MRITKRLGKSENFKYVYLISYFDKGKNTKFWRSELQKYKWQKHFALDKEKEAGMAVDLKLIEMGEEPINILVRRVRAN